MPYVTQEKRTRLNEDLLGAETAGELGYVLGLVCDQYLLACGDKSATGGFRYQHIAEVVGTLESIKLDLFRELIAPYEAQVQRDNGTVYVSNLPEGQPHRAARRKLIARLSVRAMLRTQPNGEETQ